MYPGDIDKDPRLAKHNTYGAEDHKNFAAGFRELIEQYPLYKRIKINPPPIHKHFAIEAATLRCAYCRGDRTFRATQSHAFRIPFPGGGGVEDARYLETGVYPVQLECQDCKLHNYYFIFYVVNDWYKPEHNSVMKVGQWPMWLPSAPKDIADELGADAILYKKALRNMNEGYGIGACAYLRRLVEQHINPLLELLYEMKQEEGAGDNELAEIREAIRAKDFSKKTQFAADIAPDSIRVAGTNPLKTLHDLLSESIHAHDDDEAMNIAIKLSKTVEFVIRRLKSRYEEQKQYAAAMRELNKPRPKTTE